MACGPAVLSLVHIMRTKRKRFVQRIKNRFTENNTNDNINLGGEQEIEHEEKVQLTTLTKVEETEEVDTPGCEFHQRMFSLDNQAPMEIFSRKYLLFDDVLTSGKEFTFNPFWDVLKRTMINIIRRRHKYFRCDGVKVDVQVTAPISMNGYAVCYWFPCVNPARIPLQSALQLYTWQDFVPMDFATLALADSESVEMFCKWQSPKFVMESRLGNASNMATFESQINTLGHFRIICPAMTQIDETTPTARLRVYASLVNPYLGGPRTRTPSAFETGYVPQSSNSNGLGGASLSGTYAAARNVYDGMGGAAGILATATAISKESKVLGAAFETAKDTLDYGYCTLFDCEENLVEDEEKEPVGMPERGNHASFRVNVYGDTCALMPPTNVMSLDSMPVTNGALSMQHLGTGTEANVYALCRRWSYANHGTVNPGNLTSFLPANVSPNLEARGFPRYFSNFFRFWRGSMEFRFMFFSSPLINYQAGISINWERSNIGTVNNPEGKEDIGNSIWKMVTVRGTTTVDITVPYMRPYPWERTNAFDCPLVQVSMYPSGTHMGSVNNIECPVLILYRAGPDFRFRSYCSSNKTQWNQPKNLPIPPPPNPVKYIPQGLIDHTMSTDDNIAEPYFESQAFHGTIKDLLYRASYRKADQFRKTPGGALLETTKVAADLLDYDNFDILCANFCFYSGSYILKYRITDPGLDTDQTIGFMADMGGREAGAAFSFPRYSHGVYRTETGQWKFMEISVPLLSNVAMYPTASVYMTVDNGTGGFFTEFGNTICLLESVNENQSVLPDGNVMISADKDFALHVMLPPLSANVLFRTDPFRVQYVAPSSAEKK